MIKNVRNKDSNDPTDKIYQLRSKWMIKKAKYIVSNDQKQERPTFNEKKGRSIASNDQKRKSDSF